MAKQNDKETNEDRYDDMLGAVPPIYFSSIDGVGVRGGFAVGEAYSHNNKGETIYYGFYQVGDKYYETLVKFVSKGKVVRVAENESLEYKNGANIGVFLYEDYNGKWSEVPFGLGDVIKWLGKKFTVVAFSLDRDDAEYNIVKGGKANVLTVREWGTSEDDERFRILFLDGDFMEDYEGVLYKSEYALGGEITKFTYSIGGL